MAEVVSTRLRLYANVLRERLASRQDSEHVQALIRIVFGVIFAIYLYAVLGARPDVHAFFIGFQLVSWGIFLAIVARPQRSARRRTFGALVDLGTTTYLMWANGEVGAPFYGVYLWVTFGNGFRYGVRSLYASQAMSLTGFGFVVATNRFWQDHAHLAGGLFVLLVAVPAYGAILLRTVESATRNLREEATRDALTGLYNRRYLIDTFERELHRARRAGEQLCLLVIDIDHFKRINDTFGHAAGDEALRSVAQYMQTLVRAGDILCRFGGEEFVLLQTKASAEAVFERADKLRQDVSKHDIAYQGHRIGPVTLSIGVALYPAHGTTTHAVLNAGDAALYRAKNAGRNRVVMASALDAAGG